MVALQSEGAGGLTGVIGRGRESWLPTSVSETSTFRGISKQNSACVF